MKRRTNDSERRRQILIRSLIYGVLAILLFAAAVSSAERQQTIALRDIAYIVGRPAMLTGYGLVVGLNGTGDGARLLHTDKSLLATLGHLGVDPQGTDVRIGKVAAVFVQAEFAPGTDIGVSATVRVTALNDATNLYGGTLLPLTLNSRDGRFHGTTMLGAVVDSAPPNPRAPAMGVLAGAVTCSTSVYMTDLPGREFIIELRGLNASQVAEVAARINQTLGEIAYAHSGCDIEVKLPPICDDFSERSNIVFQIANLNVEYIVPALLAEREALFNSPE